MSEFKKVAKLSELKDGEVKGVEVGSTQIALYRLRDGVLATSDICTHADCVISENFNVEDGEVECTCHGSKFDIKTGENTLPPAAEPLKTFETKVEDDNVFIKI